MAVSKVVNPNYLNDCHFFFNSSCNKGDECEFRHCFPALVNEKVCSKWRLGLCKNVTCRYRHCHVIVKRGTIKCHFEKSSEGCQKIHCPFHHDEPNEVRLHKLMTLPDNKRIFPVTPAWVKPNPKPKPKDAHRDDFKERELRAKSLTRDLMHLSLSQARAGSQTTIPKTYFEPKFEGKTRQRNSVSENLKNNKKG